MRWHCAYRSCWLYPAALNVLLVLTMAGCGSSSATVSGHVRYKGETVAAGTVTFYGPNNETAVAPIKPDGSYSATPVPLGAVKVAVVTPTPMSPKMTSALQKMKKGVALPPAPETVTIPPQYGKPDQSGLELTVSPGSRTFDIDLK